MKKILLSAFATFCFFANHAQFTSIFDFTSDTAMGKYPWGSLVSDGTFLYGMAVEGGIKNVGTIYKMKKDGSGFQKLFDFDTINGRTPYGSLIFDGSFLYGMTSAGGTRNVGVVFKIKTDGSSFTKLLDFDTANGCQPWGALITDGTYLYGMTYLGGIHNKGVVFKIKTDGTGYAKLLDFDGLNTGSKPYGSLIFDGVYLYGLTSETWLTAQGVIFKIKPDGTGFSVVTNSGTGPGIKAHGSLLSNGIYFYSLDREGGTNGIGSIIKNRKDGTAETTLLSMQITANGSYPEGSLLLNGSTLIGTTTQGDAGYGNVFSIDTNGTNFTKLHSFAAYDGASPYCTPIADGTAIYGTASTGGANFPAGPAFGTIWKYAMTTNICSAGYTLYPDTIVAHNWYALNQSTGALPITYFWNWGDGTTSTGTNPSHAYAVPGNYNICATIIDVNGCTNSYCDSSTYIYKTESMVTVNVVDQLPLQTGITVTAAANNFSLYPNPATNQLNITIDETLVGSTLNIYNTTGALIATLPLNTAYCQLPTVAFPSGVYIAEIKTKEASVKKRWVKM